MNFERERAHRLFAGSFQTFGAVECGPDRSEARVNSAYEFEPRRSVGAGRTTELAVRMGAGSFGSAGFWFLRVLVWNDFSSTVFKFGAPKLIGVLFSSKKFCKIGIVSFSFVFDKYYPIIY